MKIPFRFNLSKEKKAQQQAAQGASQPLASPSSSNRDPDSAAAALRSTRESDASMVSDENVFFPLSV
jgi:hypothetical protein